MSPLLEPKLAEARLVMPGESLAEHSGRGVARLDVKLDVTRVSSLSEFVSYCPLDSATCFPLL